MTTPQPSLNIGLNVRPVGDPIAMIFRLRGCGALGKPRLVSFLANPEPSNGLPRLSKACSLVVQHSVAKEPFSAPCSLASRVPKEVKLCVSWLVVSVCLLWLVAE